MPIMPDIPQHSVGFGNWCVNCRDIILGQFIYSGHNYTVKDFKAAIAHSREHNHIVKCQWWCGRATITQYYKNGIRISWYQAYKHRINMWLESIERKFRNAR